MKRPYQLRAPGGKRKTYSFRCHIKGLGQFEISTKETDETAAWDVAAGLWDMIQNDPLTQGKAALHPIADLPEVMPLGPFELFLLSNFTLVGEVIFQLGSGKTVVFYASAHGYRQAVIPWAGQKKKVLEHRFKFLLHHRWLPRSIDHINRIRHDNELANLRASNPQLQSNNRARGGAGLGKNLQLVVSK